ncbi:MAG: alanine racemase [Clostridiales bacterium]|nr:alanine racemase [Clostridiales bacterium]
MKRRKFLKRAGASAGFAAIAPLVRAIPAGSSRSEALPQQAAGSMDSRVDINLSHLAWNMSRIKQLVSVPIMAVVKANAYGHGLVDVARHLEKQGIGWLMVGKLDEAVKLRERGLRCRILNFGAFSKQDADEIVSQDISQAVWSDKAGYLHEAALKKGKKASVHIDVDTGMGRTGVPWNKALPLLIRLAETPGLRIEGTMTTLTEDEDFDREQLLRFQDICSKANQKGISVGLRHAASSAGILASSEFHLDMVRPGIMIYGYYPSEKTQEDDRLALKPVARWMAWVIDIRELAPGETLSYHRVFKATRAMRAATVGVGYSDGYPAQLAGKSRVLIKGKKFHVIAAVTANHMMVDLDDDAAVKVGDEVVLMDDRPGSGLTADALASLSGTSAYKILIGLNPLLPRHYV